MKLRFGYNVMLINLWIPSHNISISYTNTQNWRAKVSLTNYQDRHTSKESKTLFIKAIGCCWRKSCYYRFWQKWVRRKRKRSANRLYKLTKSIKSLRFFSICWGGRRRIKSNAQSNCRSVCRTRKVTIF